MRTRSLVLLLTLLALTSLSGTVFAEEPSPSWFTVSRVAENTWRIDDHGADNLYLVAGKEKALLIDTGLGVGDIMKVVRTLTPLPLVVVDTHGHPDHVGGNNQFPEVYAHPDDFELIRSFSSKEQRAGTRANMLKGAQPPTEQLFQEPESAQPTKLLPATGGFVFDLGGRRLEVIATPGHGGALDEGFVGEQIACARSILDGSCKDEPYESFAGEARLCRHGRAAIAFDPKKLR